MPFNGSGTYVPPSLPGSFNPAISGQQATPADWNTLLTDLSTALSTTMTRDGQSVPTNNIPMGGFRLTNVGNATALSDATTAGQVQNARHTYAIDTGAVNAFTIAPVPACAAYQIGQSFQFKAIHSNNTSTPTLAVSGLTAGIISYPNGDTLPPSGAIVTNGLYEVIVASVTAGTPTFHLQTSNDIAVTQTQANNATKLATTAYVDRVAVQQVVTFITGAVATGSTTIPFDDTVPQNTEGDEYMTLAITPKSATSKLLIEVAAWASQNAASANTIIAALFQDSTANALAAMAQQVEEQFAGVNIGFQYEMTSGTTSATTFKVRIGAQTAVPATITFNGSAGNRLFGGVMASSIIITEFGI